MSGNVQTCEHLDTVLSNHTVLPVAVHESGVDLFKLDAFMSFLIHILVLAFFDAFHNLLLLLGHG